VVDCQEQVPDSSLEDVPKPKPRQYPKPKVFTFEGFESEEEASLSVSMSSSNPTLIVEELDEIQPEETEDADFSAPKKEAIAAQIHREMGVQSTFTLDIHAVAVNPMAHEKPVAAALETTQPTLLVDIIPTLPKSMTMSIEEVTEPEQLDASVREEFFKLSCLAVKINSAYMESVCQISANDLYAKAK
jgi:hypothetical protein